MHRTRTRHILAVLLIANFVFCNTPTSVLHSLFARHADEKVECKADPSLIHFDPSGIDCHCNSNVVNVTYLQPDIIGLSDPFFIYLHFHEVTTDAPIIASPFHFSLRGPPVAV